MNGGRGRRKASQERDGNGGRDGVECLSPIGTAWRASGTRGLVHMITLGHPPGRAASTSASRCSRRHQKTGVRTGESQPHCPEHELLVAELLDL